MKIHLHYVDDSKTFLLSVEKIFQKNQTFSTGKTPVEFSIQCFSSEQSYLKALSEKSCETPDVILLDMDMDGDQETGVRLARHTRQLFKDAQIVMLTQMEDAKTVATCMAAGVNNFLTKSAGLENLPQAVLDTIQLTQRVKPSIEQKDHRYAGAMMQQIAARAPSIIASAIRSVHVFGETGTGKEIVADIFAAALPAGTPFIRLNCGAIPPNLVESELFGATRGAYTGSNRDRAGVFEEASGGWLFLDEVALLPSYAQMAVLRALENQEITRVGETKVRKINVRIISATNESLAQGVEDGKFRRDLWQRLCETTIELLPLRKRLGELPELVNFFASSMEGGPYTVPSTTLELLKQHTWSAGNIRELRNTLRAMTELQVNQVLWPKSVPSWVYEKKEDAKPVPQGDDEIKLAVDMLRFNYHDLEDKLLAESILLFSRQGKVSLNRLQNHLGLSKSTLSRRVKALIASGKLPADQFERLQDVGSDEDAASQDSGEKKNH